jgi:hypothetical protein
MTVRAGSTARISSPITRSGLIGTSSERNRGFHSAAVCAATAATSARVSRSALAVFRAFSRPRSSSVSCWSTSWASPTRPHAIGYCWDRSSASFVAWMMVLPGGSWNEPSVVIRLAPMLRTTSASGTKAAIPGLTAVPPEPTDSGWSSGKALLPT